MTEILTVFTGSINACLQCLADKYCPDGYVSVLAVFYTQIVGSQPQYKGSSTEFRCHWTSIKKGRAVFKWLI